MAWCGHPLEPIEERAWNMKSAGESLLAGVPVAVGTAIVGLLLCSTSVQATTLPFTEEFTDDVADWADNTGLDLTHVGSGGPDGGAYASTTFVLENRGGESVILFRGQDELGSSNGAFEGNWITEGVAQFSAFVRHDAPQPLNFLTRFSGPGNFPGAVAVSFAPVPPDTWTLIEFDIRPDNPEFVTFEGTNFNTVFSNIGHVQVGISVPESLDSVSTPFTFDLDKSSIAPVPEPASWILAVGPAMAGLMWWMPKRCLTPFLFSTSGGGGATLSRDGTATSSR
jgi:hypothetical protein